MTINKIRMMIKEHLRQITLKKEGRRENNFIKKRNIKTGRLTYKIKKYQVKREYKELKIKPRSLKKWL